MSNNIILSGRYELLRHLGSGTSSAVYLARHISLERDCAIKIYPKSNRSSLTLLSEAQLLKTFHHPCIPTVYDIEEDADNFYLVEEFIPGESLEEYLLHQKSISQSLLFTFCEQLCDVFDYLHTHGSTPVFYQDLKPEHLIVCGDRLRLVDFGSTLSGKPRGNNFKLYGNRNFSAPETISERSITAASDIYSIGKLMEYLAGYLEEGVPHTIQQIIQRATMQKPEERYDSIHALTAALQQIHMEAGQPHLLHTIAVVGSAPGCGATHIAIALCSALNAMGYPCLYYEENESRCLMKMARWQHQMAEHREGYYTYRHFQGYPKYGTGIRISRPNNILAVMDYGTIAEDFEPKDFDLLLLICPDASWHRDDVIEKTKLLRPYQNRLKPVCNPGEREAARFYAKQFQAPVYPYFGDADPFRVERRKELFVKQLLSLPEKGRKNPFLSAKGKHIIKNPFA